MTELYRVLYCSRYRLGTLTAAGVQEILAVSRQNNTRDEITGALLFSAGVFAQILEGPLDAVQDVFERIQCDQRHHDIIVLQSGSIAARDFPHWAMAYAQAEDLGHPLTLVTLNKAFASPTECGSELLDLLKTIVARETDWRQPAAAAYPYHLINQALESDPRSP